MFVLGEKIFASQTAYSFKTITSHHWQEHSEYLSYATVWIL